MTEPSPTPSRAKLILNLCYSLIPLLAFWIIEQEYGVEAGVIVAIILAIIEVVWIYVRERRLESFAVWSAVLIIIMGIVSWQTKDKMWIYLKPAIFEGIFAAIFIITSIIGKPFMLIMAQRQFGHDQPFNEFQLRYFRGLNWRIGILFIIHTALTVYTAIWYQDAWAFVKLPLFFILFAIFFAGEFVYSRFTFRHYLERLQSQQDFLQYQKNMIEQIRKK